MPCGLVVRRADGRNSGERPFPSWTRVVALPEARYPRSHVGVLGLVGG